MNKEVTEGEQQATGRRLKIFRYDISLKNNVQHRTVEIIVL
jgi:hypothetical protein